MIKENQKYLNRIQIVLDLSLVVVSMTIAYWGRFVLLDGNKSLSQEQIIQITGCAVLLYGALYSRLGLYRPKRRESLFKEFTEILQANTVGLVCLMVGFFFFKIQDFSRGQLAIFFITNVILMLLERGVIRIVLRHFRSQGFNLRHCLVIGANEISDDFINRVEKNKHWGYRIEGILDNWIVPAKEYRGYPVLGRIDKLVEVLLQKYFDLVIIALTSEDAEELGYILAQCEKAGVKSNVIPYYYKYVPTQPYMDDLDGLPVIDTRRVPLDNWFKSGLKRAFDIVFALTAIVITSPVMLFSVLMIKLTSPGPVIFHQERVGLNHAADCP